MATCANLGFPRIGKNRELKRALESYWAGKSDLAALEETARRLRAAHWKLQKDSGINLIPSNDFSYYDQVLDTTCMVGAIPRRFGFSGSTVTPEIYFAMARGNDKAAAMEMTKWFDTNYHFIVPEFEDDPTFSPASSKAVEEFVEARDQGIDTRPVLLGPVSYLLLGKTKGDAHDPLQWLDRLLPVYAQVIEQLKVAGAKAIQLDEPTLVLDLDDTAAKAFATAYARLAVARGDLSLCLTTYFGELGDNFKWIPQLPFESLHLDLVRGREQLDRVLAELPSDRCLSLGVVNGRNIWRTDLAAALDTVDKATAALGPERVIVAPSCSLLHSPVDVEGESRLDPRIRERLAFARQKLEEIAVLSRGSGDGRAAIQSELEANKALFEKQKVSREVNNPAVRERLADVTKAMFERPAPFAERKAAQQAELNLPPLPTTTIGSFPQTPDIRKTRAAFRKGTIEPAEYTEAMHREIERVIRFQEEAGLDVLVHGEPERNDMVEYFGQWLDGFAFTQNGWVQSYGSRCVKPPIIYGDVGRPRPMTVDWSTYAQSLSAKPVKGMLTGPITILQWSFVREDQPRRDTAFQIALSIRDEVSDLESAGIGVIQIDEPALREGLPLRKAEQAAYLDWAVQAFRLSTSGVRNKTQVHTHMCYSDFNEIIESIAGLDADVISIEASRSDIELLDAFVAYDYPNDIGPGVYDIHSPRVPPTEDMVALLRRMIRVLKAEQLWVNPDCGLKTRQWPEVKDSLRNMVDAARKVREELR